jgi:hypothetical protein
LLTVVALAAFLDDEAVDGDVALAAAGGNDHVHRGAGLEIFFQARIIERKACCIDANRCQFSIWR